PRIEYKRIASLLSYHVGGIILVPSVDPAGALDAIALSGTPVVVVDRPVAQGRFDQVTFDNRDAMSQAARRLIELGPRRIRFVVRQRALATTRERIIALRTAVRGTSVSASVLECTSYDTDAITARLMKMLSVGDMPTAIIASNSMFASCVLRTFE